MLEQVRKKLRDLVRFIEKRKRKLLYTDFEDEIGEATSFDLLGVAPPQDMERFRAKARAFLETHQDHIAIHRLRMNKPLTATDLAELEACWQRTAWVMPRTSRKRRRRARGWACSSGH